MYTSHQFTMYIGIHILADEMNECDHEVLRYSPESSSALSLPCISIFQVGDVREMRTGLGAAAARL